MNFFNFFKSDSDDDDLYNVPKEFHKEILSIYGDYPEMPYFSPDRDFKFWIDTMLNYLIRLYLNNIWSDYLMVY